MAYRLQNEEISQHYDSNRCKNRLVREDLPIAQNLQRSEEEVATEVRLSYERMLEEQLEADARVAREIQDRIREQDFSQKRVEEEDERLAKRLAQKERARIAKKRLERERQQVEKLSAQLRPNSADNAIDAENQELVGAVNQSIDALHIRDTNNASPLSDDELDLSEFCLQPPAGLSAEELRVFLEEQDAEIARLLQQQELKRKSTSNKEKLAQIEAQDYEIARLLQKQEKERVRRLKERAKQKALQKQLEENQSNNDLLAENSRKNGGNSCDINSIQRQSNGLYTEYRPEIRQPSSYYSDADSITYEEINHQLSYHPNIATLLDPTYKPNPTVLSNPLLNSSPVSRHDCPQTPGIVESNVDDIEPEDPGIHFAQVYKVTPTPSPTDSPYSTTQRSQQELEPIEDNYYPIEEVSRRNRPSPVSPVAPYLPVQGQRRLSSMEKKKKSKDSCKTQ